MKKLLIALMFFVAFAGCAQDRYDSPQTVAWDHPGADGFEVAVRVWGEADILLVAEVALLSQCIDFESMGIYGYYQVIVRAFVDVDTPWGVERKFSEYGVSDFCIQRESPVLKPLMIRIQ